jgi:hypothetical protein
MRSYVAEATGGEDTLRLHEEKPLTIEDQQALALAAQMVSEDAQLTFQADQPIIQELAQKVQQAKQAAMQQAAESDPAAQVILKTQMAETERKSKEFEAKMQQEVQKNQQEYELKIADMERKVQELIAKYSTQTDIDGQRNATDVALANINNASKERVATINAQGQLTSQQIALEHEQNMSAIEAINAAEKDIRQHGLAVEHQQFQNDATLVQKAIDAQQLQQKPTGEV